MAISSENIVILTGAGVSAESGVKTFRDDGGLWEGHRLEDVATPQAFGSKPDLVHDFYNQRRRQLAEVEPNASHVALAELERALGDRVLLVTQNVDNLHERAGSKRCLHMHGELRKKSCVWCEAVFACDGDLAVTDCCPSCGRDRGMRPRIVWFGEIPLHLEEIGSALQSADLFVAIGTSGVVSPASQFVYTAKVYGARTVELNLDAAANTAGFDESILGPASQTVPAFVESLLRGD